MKKRYTEEQIVQILRDGQTAGNTPEVCRKIRDLGVDVLPVEEKVRRHRGQRPAAPAHARSRERQAQTDGRRAGAGRPDLPGDPGEKRASVTEKRPAVSEMIRRGIAERSPAGPLA